MVGFRKKKIRKNIRKDSPAAKRARRIQCFFLFGKIILFLITIPVMSTLFIFGHDLLTQCKYFRTEKIIVQGVERLSYEEILRQSHLEMEMNLLSINLPLTRKRLVGHPWIKEAEVRRELPDTLFLCITEQEALAVLDLGQKFIMNTDGEIFKRWSFSDPRDLPLVTGLKYYDLKSEDDPGSIRLASVMEVLQLGGKNGCVLPCRMIRRIEVDQQIGLTLYAFKSETSIRLGFNEYNSKLTGLKKVLSHLRTRDSSIDFRAIDLVNPSRIVVFPKKAEATADHQKEA